MSAPPRGRELAAIYAVSVSNIKPIEWEGENVITTVALANAYGASSSNIHDNHRKNRDRFVEGRHYHKLTGDELAGDRK
jgi:hypothetical protein